MFTYLVCDYSATGEGRTVSVLVQRDYVYERSYVDGENKTREERMRAAFASTFGDFWAIGVEELTQKDFEEQYIWTMPEMVYDLITEDDPPGFAWHTQIHFNFS
jgi:hypothetical protein